MQVPPAVPGVDGPADVAAHGRAAGALEMEKGKVFFYYIIIVKTIIRVSPDWGIDMWSMVLVSVRQALSAYFGTCEGKIICKTQFRSLLFIPDKFGRKCGRGMSTVVCRYSLTTACSWRQRTSPSAARLREEVGGKIIKLATRNTQKNSLPGVFPSGQTWYSTQQ